MPVRSVKLRPARKPASPSKPRKPSLTAERLEQLIAERARVPARCVSVFVDGEDWNAVLIVNPIGNAERKARVRSIVNVLRDQFCLDPD